MGSVDGQIAAYLLMRVDQMQMIQNKQQREICWSHQRMTEFGIPRHKYQSNGGRRPVETEEMGPEVDWPAQNPNPFDPESRRRRAQENGTRPVPTGSSDSYVSSVGENAEDGERRVFN